MSLTNISNEMKTDLGKNKANTYKSRAGHK